MLLVMPENRRRYWTAVGRAAALRHTYRNRAHLRASEGARRCGRRTPSREKSASGRGLRPDRALRRARHGADALEHELLEAFPLPRFSREQVAFRVDRDAVDAEELPGLTAAVAKARDDLQRLPLDHVDALVHSVGKEQVLLLGIFREGDVPRRSAAERVFLDELLFDELAFWREHLQPIVHAIADVDQAIDRDVGAVHGVPELLRRRRGGAIPSLVGIVGLVPVRAPDALEDA